MMQHQKFLASVLMAALCCVGSIEAVASPYGDDMAKCLVKFASATDRNIFLKWLFAAMALNPEVEAMVLVSAEQRDEINKDAGALVTRLLTESCRSETQQAIRYEGPATVQYAFQVFGQAAAGDLLANPRVAEGMKGLAKYLDEGKFKSLMSEGATK